MECAGKRFQDIINSFDRFNNQYASVSKERDEFAEKIKFYTSEYERLLKSNEDLQRDLKEMHGMVSKFHQQVIQIDMLNDSNKTLKEKCATLEEEIQTKGRQYEDKLRDHEAEHEQKLTSVIKSKERDAEKERQRMLDVIDKKDAEMSQLKESMAKARQEKEDEITVLSMDYENKLAKVQKQKSQIIQNNQHTANQDIFRKKLQHMKKTHAEEVSCLKQQITQLQERVTAGPAQPIPLPRPSHFTSLFGTKSKRK